MVKWRYSLSLSLSLPLVRYHSNRRETKEYRQSYSTWANMPLLREATARGLPSLAPVLLHNDVGEG